MSDFLMPSLGADMEGGTLVEWLVKPGSTVKRGDVVAVVESQKGAIEIEVFEDGVVAELCVREGETVPVGTLLARIAHPGDEAVGQSAAPAPVAAPPAAGADVRREATPPPLARIAPPGGVAPPAAGSPGTRIRVTPVARRRAAELGIDPDAVNGTGIEGSVTLADVEAATAAAPTGADDTARSRRGGFDPQRMRQAIAAAMSRSKREIPHYYLTTTIDMGRALSWLKVFNSRQPPHARLLPAALLLRATAMALGNAPQLNGFWEDESFRSSAAVHVGWAVSLRGGGLVAPAIRDADKLSLTAVMTALRDLVARARSGGLRSSELTDPTFTVTSLGDRGADGVMGIIYPPQVAILGLGRVAERPWVVEGQVVPRPLLAASLAGDHRASDGHAGGLFLEAVDHLLQEPEKL